MSFLTGMQSRAIVAGDAGPQEQCRHGHVFDNKHMHSHIRATFGRAGSVTKSAIISPDPLAQGGWVLFLSY